MLFVAFIGVFFFFYHLYVYGSGSGNCRKFDVLCLHGGVTALAADMALKTTIGVGPNSQK